MFSKREDDGSRMVKLSADEMELVNRLAVEWGESPSEAVREAIRMAAFKKWLQDGAPGDWRVIEDAPLARSKSYYFRKVEASDE